MKPEKTSPDLEQLKQLLAKSYDGSEGEDIPPLPDSLRDRLADQYGRSAATPSPVAERGKVGLFASLAQLFATPAMRAVAAVVILLLVVTVVISTGPESTQGVVRGGGENLSGITCILHQLDADEQKAVAASGLDERALRTTDSPAALDAALQGEGVRIVLDGENDLILGYLPGDTAPSIEEPLPGDPGTLTAKVAEMAAKLGK